MFAIAWHNLIREKTRLAISVVGVAFAVLLILLLRGLYVGVTAQTTAYIRSVDTDLWVAQAGSTGDFFHSVSLMPATFQQRIAAVQGVRRVTPLVGRAVVFRHGHSDLDFFLLGVDPRQPVARAPGIEDGKRVPGPGEIVVDRVFSRKSGIGIGDAVRVEHERFRVVGIARGGNAVLSQFAWGSFEDVRKLLGASGVVNYYLVKGDHGQEADRLAARIGAEVPGTKPLTSATFVDKNTADIREGFLPLIWVLVVIGFAIGTAVIGLTIYTATLEKRREYGVLKAIGFSNRRLVAIVTEQSLLAGSLGFVVGVALTYALAALVERLLPSFVISLSAGDLALVAAAAAAMSLVSSLIPMRPVTRLDPAQVFRV